MTKLYEPREDTHDLLAQFLCSPPLRQEQQKQHLRHSQLPRYLQEVCPNALVRALLGHLLGEPGDLVGRLGDVLGALDEGALVAAAASDQARHLGHEQRHALRRRDDVVPLHGTTRSLLLPGRWQVTAQQQ